MALGHEKAATGSSEATSWLVASHELDKLRRRFPGMQQDQRVIDLFHHPDTGVVSVIGLDGAYDPDRYQLGGSVDFDVEATRDNSYRESGMPVIGPFYKAAEIWQK